MNAIPSSSICRVFRGKMNTDDIRTEIIGITDRHSSQIRKNAHAQLRTVNWSLQL